MTKNNTKQDAKNYARDITTRITSRDIQPRGNAETKKAAPIVIHGMAMSRHLNTN
ncbi:MULTISPECIES: hypothetical protein [Bacillus]|uniref:hypothetical protein n=1 Tax=Bacillus TaxID=1386 RepID=UPI0013FD8A3B|nr:MULTISPECIES: hypothetical protein [Bacillus]MCU5440503.1 hypothetical protein [Bacillus cereus]